MTIFTGTEIRFLKMVASCRNASAVCNAMGMNLNEALAMTESLRKRLGVTASGTLRDAARTWLWSNNMRNSELHAQ